MAKPLIHIVSLPTNDLVKVLQKNGIQHQVHATQSSAIDAANIGDALLLLARALAFAAARCFTPFSRIKALEETVFDPALA